MSVFGLLPIWYTNLYLGVDKATDHVLLRYFEGGTVNFQTFFFSLLSWLYTHSSKASGPTNFSLPPKGGQRDRIKTSRASKTLEPRRELPGAVGEANSKAGLNGLPGRWARRASAVARLAAMASALSSHKPVVAATSPQEAGSPPPPPIPPARRRRRRQRQRLFLPLRHLHRGLSPGWRRWRGGGQ